MLANTNALDSKIGCNVSGRVAPDEQKHYLLLFPSASYWSIAVLHIKFLASGAYGVDVVLRQKSGL